jgi:hypothetical protein
MPSGPRHRHSAGGTDWTALPTFSPKEVYMAQEFAGGGARLHDDGQADVTHTLGVGDLAGGVRRVEGGDAAFQSRSDLKSCLQAYSTMSFRAWVRRHDPRLADRLDKLIADALGSGPGAPIDPGTVPTDRYARDSAGPAFEAASPYSRERAGAVDSSAAYAAGPDGQWVRLPPR